MGQNKQHSPSFLNIIFLSLSSIVSVLIITQYPTFGKSTVTCNFSDYSNKLDNKELNALKKFIENYTSLPAEEWKQIFEYFEKRIIEKDEFVLQEGKICGHIYFVESGLLRFFIQKDGNDVTKFFTEAPYFFTSQASFNSQKPSTENIQAIEKSVVWQISYQQVNDLYKLKSWTDFARKIIQEVQFFTEEILEELQTVTAEKRYEKMLKKSPALLLRIPLKYLASYLSIAPQSLSRIRKKMSAQKQKLT